MSETVLTVDVPAKNEDPGFMPHVLVTPSAQTTDAGDPVVRVTAPRPMLIEWLLKNAKATIDEVDHLVMNARHATLGHAFKAGVHADEDQGDDED